MKLLVIGSGGREHAIAWRLAQSPRVQKVFVAPGNGGTARENGLENVPITDIGKLAEFALARDRKHAHIGLRRKYLPSCRVDLGRDYHLDERLAHGFGCLGAERPVEGDDASEGRGGIGGECAIVRLADRRSDRGPAGIRVLHDHTRRLGEGLDALPGRVGVGDIVERQLLAL